MTLKSDGRKMDKWRNIICSMLGKLNIVKMTTFPKLLCRLNKILILQNLMLASFEKHKWYTSMFERWSVDSVQKKPWKSNHHHHYYHHHHHHHHYQNNPHNTLKRFLWEVWRQWRKTVISSCLQFCAIKQSAWNRINAENFRATFLNMWGISKLGGSVG